MRPDVAKHNPDPEYIRSLLKRAGLTQQQAADRLGISRLSVLLYVSRNPAKWTPVPYPVQFALEVLAEEYERR